MTKPALASNNKSPSTTKKSLATFHSSSDSEQPEVLTADALLQCRTLPKDYYPSQYDIICGRGRGNYNAPGNKRFRQMVCEYMDQYLAQTSKTAKTTVLMALSDRVRAQNNGTCRFVKQQRDGSWVELGEIAEREKVGHSMREALATRRKQERGELAAAASNSGKESCSSNATNNTRSTAANPTTTNTKPGSTKTSNTKSPPPAMKTTTVACPPSPSYASESSHESVVDSTPRKRKASTACEDHMIATQPPLLQQHEGMPPAASSLQHVVVHTGTEPPPLKKPRPCDDELLAAAAAATGVGFGGSNSSVANRPDDLQQMPTAPASLLAPHLLAHSLTTAAAAADPSKTPSPLLPSELANLSALANLSQLGTNWTPPHAAPVVGPSLSEQLLHLSAASSTRPLLLAPHHHHLIRSSVEATRRANLVSLLELQRRQQLSLGLLARDHLSQPVPPPGTAVLSLAQQHSLLSALRGGREAPLR